MLPNTVSSPSEVVTEVIEASQRAVADQRVLPDNVVAGQGGRQGDLYYWSLDGPPSDLPSAKRRVRTRTCPGNSVQYPGKKVTWNAPRRAISLFGNHERLDVKR